LKTTKSAEQKKTTELKDWLSEPQLKKVTEQIVSPQERRIFSQNILDRPINIFRRKDGNVWLIDQV